MESDEVTDNEMSAIEPVATWQWVGMALIATVATVPFLNKAFHIDDVLYLRVAEQITHNPLDPYHGIVLWDAPDHQPASLFATDFNPPLWKYVLAGAIAVLGREEYKLHLVESVATFFATWGTFQLARRFTKVPLATTCLVILSPFFLPGQNLMLEAPLLCLATWSIEFLWRGWDNDDARWSCLAGLTLSAAVMTKYTAGLLLLLLAMACVLKNRRRHLVFLMPPLVTLALWNGHNLWAYGQSHLLSHFGSHRGVFGWGEWRLRALVLLRTIGSVALLAPLVVASLLRRGSKGFLAILIGAGMAVGVAILDRDSILKRSAIETPQWTAPREYLAHVLFFTGQGSFVVLGLAASSAFAWRNGERSLRPLDSNTFLDLWIAGYLCFNISSVPFQAVRHLLLGLVPLVFRLASEMGEPSGWTWSRRLTLGISVGLAGLLAWGDYEIAGCYRRLAQEDVAASVRRGKRTWFTGDWGFLYYASRPDVGGWPLVENPESVVLPPLTPGDVIYHPRLVTWKGFPPKNCLPLRPMAHLQPTASAPIRTLAPLVHYYAVLPLALPWMLVIQRPHEVEKEAIFELPPLDDVIVYEALPR